MNDQFHNFSNYFFLLQVFSMTCIIIIKLCFHVARFELYFDSIFINELQKGFFLLELLMNEFLKWENIRVVSFSLRCMMKFILINGLKLR